MNAKEYHQADVEVIDMVNQGFRRSRAADELAEKSNRNQLLVTQSREAENEAWKDKVNKIMSAFARGGVGILILGAVTREWIVPGLGIMAASLCFIWAFLAVRHGAVDAHHV